MYVYQIKMAGVFSQWIGDLKSNLSWPCENHSSSHVSPFKLVLFSITVTKSLNSCSWPHTCFFFCFVLFL